MFRGCTELSVKRTGGFWTLLFEVLPDVVPDSVYDATHANTGTDGYLTAK